MLKIAICEDNFNESKLLCKWVNQYFAARRTEIEIQKYCTGTDLMAVSDKKEYDFYLLDIVLGGNIDGIAVGKSIQNLYPHAAIVFITGFEEYQDAAFQMHAFHYLLKPIDKETIRDLFNDYFKSKDSPSKPYITVMENRRYVKIILDDIIYITSETNQVIYHTIYGQVREYNKLKTVLQTLGPQFMRAHKSFVVNMYRICSLDKSACHMERDIDVSVGRLYYNDLKKRFIELSMEDD